MEGLVYLDGQILPAEDAKISVLDLSILRGYGVFDFLRTYQGYPFRLWDHLKRFEASAKQIDIPLPLTMNEVADVIEQLLEKAPFHEANIKIFLTGGQSTDQYLPEDRPTFFALVYPIQPFPAEIYQKGVALVSEVYERPFPACKSIHYLPAIVAIRRAKKKGGHDVLFLSHNRTLLETGTANFFGIKGSTVVTTGEGIIFGITRQVILELLEKQGVSVEVRNIDYEELGTFDGAFITSSSKEVVPVVQVDEIGFPMHPLVQKLMKDFSSYTKSIESPFQKVL